MGLTLIGHLAVITSLPAAMISRLVKSFKGSERDQDTRSEESSSQNENQRDELATEPSLGPNVDSETIHTEQPGSSPSSSRIRGPVQPIGESPDAKTASENNLDSDTQTTTKKVVNTSTPNTKAKPRAAKKKPAPKPNIRRKRAPVDNLEMSDDEEAASSANANETSEDEASQPTSIQGTDANKDTNVQASPLLGSSPPIHVKPDLDASHQHQGSNDVRRRKSRSLPFEDGVIFSAQAPSTALEFDKYDKNAVRDFYLNWAVENGFSVHIRKSNDKPLMGAVFVRLTCKENRAQREKSKRRPHLKPCPWSLRLNKKRDEATGQYYWVPHQVCGDHNHLPLENPQDMVGYRKLFKRTYAKTIQESINAGKSYDEIIADLQSIDSLKRLRREDIPISKKDILNAKTALRVGRSSLFPLDT